MMIATGAQGEEYAALMRIANKTHKGITLNKTDTVLLSSSVIPGNEYSTTKLKDNLYRSEAKIITFLLLTSPLKLAIFAFSCSGLIFFIAIKGICISLLIF